MANKKAKECKMPYGYRIEPSVQKRCAKKAKKEKKTLSKKVAELLHDYDSQ